MNEIKLKNDNELALISEIKTVWADYRQAPVLTHDDYEQAAIHRAALKSYVKQLKEIKSGHTKPIDELKRSVLDFFGQHEKTLERALESIDTAMLAYHAEVERQQKEEQRKIEEWARKKEQEERARLEAEALRALQSGKEDAAMQLVQQAESVAVAMPVLAPAKVISETSVTKEYWEHEVVNPELVPDEFRIIDNVKLGAYGRAMKDKASVPGVRFFPRKGIAGKRC